MIHRSLGGKRGEDSFGETTGGEGILGGEGKTVGGTNDGVSGFCIVLFCLFLRGRRGRGKVGASASGRDLRSQVLSRGQGGDGQGG